MAYLSATKDLATKEIVAFNISKELDLYSTYGNFADFLKSKNCSDLIIHSDQGWHYTHPYYVNKLKELGITQSMSRKGNCLDNAPIESFFGHLKDEVDLKSCQTFDELKIKVENYIYYYNNEHRLNADAFCLIPPLDLHPSGDFFFISTFQGTDQ